MSWKMLFLMVLLCREAELPPRWREGLSWPERRTETVVTRYQGALYYG
jgi:hypothetical protein